jgi:hypothetical protein
MAHGNWWKNNKRILQVNSPKPHAGSACVDSSVLLMSAVRQGKLQPRPKSGLRVLCEIEKQAQGKILVDARGI